jgi:hypothetical protein
VRKARTENDLGNVFEAELPPTQGSDYAQVSRIRGRSLVALFGHREAVLDTDVDGSPLVRPRFDRDDVARLQFAPCSTR